MINYYQVLGLSFGSSTEQIRKAYREYAKHFHPDKHQNNDFFKVRFQDLQRAYEILIDEDSRRQYEQAFLGSSYGSSTDTLRKEVAEERQRANRLETLVIELRSQLNAAKAEFEAAIRVKQAKASDSVVAPNQGAGWRFAFFLLLILCCSWTLFSFYSPSDTKSIVPHGQEATNNGVTTNATISVAFPESFEAGTKKTYEAASQELNTGTWLLTEALIGNTVEDHKNGEHAVRLRTGGRITMQFDAQTGVRRISILTSVYSQDGPSTWELWMSRDHGRTWQRNGYPQNTSGSVLRPAIFTGLANEPIRLEIRKTDSSKNRLNVDDISIETAAGPASAAIL
jgi:hypothetical protein